LYLLFVGAVFHAAFVKPNGDMTLLQIIDLGLSIVPMGAAIRIALDAMARGGDAPAR
jgi:hypothetical protein